MDRFIASTVFQGVAVEATLNIGSYTDQNCNVTLVTVPFIAAEGIDQSLIPGNITEFTELSSNTLPDLITTIDPPGRSLLWPDPLGGWNFTSIAGTFPVTVTGYRVDSDDGNFLGCQNIPSQVITAAGQSVVLGEIRVPITDPIFEGL